MAIASLKRMVPEFRARRDYGALGDGSDDTAALTKCFSDFAATVVAGGGGRLIVEQPLGASYNITGTSLALPVANNWLLEGEGIVPITQNTPNLEVMKLLIPGSAGVSQAAGWKIDGFSLQAAVAQPNTNTHSLGLALGCTGNVAVGGIWDFIIGHLEGVNLYKTAAFAKETLDGGFSLAIWQCLIEKMVGINCSGALLHIGGQNAGAPGIEILSLYAQTGRLAVAETAVLLQACGSPRIDVIEINDGFNTTPQFEFIDCLNVTVDTLRFENMTWSIPSEFMGYVGSAGKPATFRNIELTFPNIDLPSGGDGAFLFSAQGAYVRFENLVFNNPRQNASVGGTPVGTLVICQSSNLTDAVTGVVYAGKYEYDGPAPITQYDALSPHVPPPAGWWDMTAAADIITYPRAQTYVWGATPTPGSFAGATNGLPGNVALMQGLGWITRIDAAMSVTVAGGPVQALATKNGAGVDNGAVNCTIPIGQKNAFALYSPGRQPSGAFEPYSTKGGDPIGADYNPDAGLSSGGTLTISIQVYPGGGGVTT